MSIDHPGSRESRPFRRGARLHGVPVAWPALFAGPFSGGVVYVGRLMSRTDTRPAGKRPSRGRRRAVPAAVS